MGRPTSAGSRPEVGLAVAATAVLACALAFDAWSRQADISAVPAWRGLAVLALATGVQGAALLVALARRRTGVAVPAVLATVALVAVVALRWDAGVGAAATRFTAPLAVAAGAASAWAAWRGASGHGAGVVLDLAVRAWMVVVAAALVARGLAGDPPGLAGVRSDDLRLLGTGLALGAAAALVRAVVQRERRASAEALVVGGLAMLGAGRPLADAERWWWGVVAAAFILLWSGVPAQAWRAAHGDRAARGRVRGRAALADVRRRSRRVLRGARSGSRAVGALAWRVARRAALTGPRGSLPRATRIEGRDRRWAIALTAIATGTVLANLVWAFRVGYEPIGHGATIATRSYDVLHGRQPLTGMPTSFADYQNGVETYHPGPMLFDLYAPFIRFLGLRTGTIVVAGVMNLLFWLLAAWAGFRAGGRSAGLAAWVGGAVIINVLLRDASFESTSTFVLFVSIMTVPLLCWAAVTGTRAALPIAVTLMNLNVQTYLAHALVTAVPVLVAVVIVAVEARQGPGERAARRALVLSLVISLVCWIPPLYDAAVNGGGNIRALWLAMAADTPTIGLGGLLLAVRWMLQVPFAWGRLDQPFAPDYHHYLDGTTLVGPSLLAGLAILAFARRDHASAALRRLWAVALSVLLAAGLSLAKFPVAFTAFYQLTWLACSATFLWIVVVLTLWQLVAVPALATRPAAPSLRAPVAAACALLVLVGGVRTPASLETVKGRFALIDAAVPTLVSAADRVADGEPRVLVIALDGADQQTMADVVTTNLVTRGHDVYVESAISSFYGRFRALPIGWQGTALLLVDGAAPTDPPGRRLARVEPPGWSQDRYDRVAAKVGAWARAHGPIEVTPVIAQELTAYLAPWMPEASCRELAALSEGRQPLASVPDGALARLYADDAVLSPEPSPALRAEISDVLGRTPMELWDAPLPRYDEQLFTGKLRTDLATCP